MTLPRAIGWPLFCIGTGITIELFSREVARLLAGLCG